MGNNTEFIDAIEHYLSGVDAFSVGACPGCAECGLEDLEDLNDDPERVDLAHEPSFSGSSCDSCGSSLGGDRHGAHGFINDELVHFEVCTDCLVYHANGELPFDDARE